MFSMIDTKYLWGEAILTTTYLINRIPTLVLYYVTPLDYLKKPFHTSHIFLNLPLKIFGCTTYVHINSKRRSKLDPKAEKSIFIGYAPNKKGYKCFNPKTKKIIVVSMDVIFLESQACFKKISL